MKTPSKIVAATTTLAFALAPAAALAHGGSGTHGGSQTAPGHTKSGSNSSTPPSNAKAYGKYCQGESKTHVAGQKGTPYSECVVAAAKLRRHSGSKPTGS